MDFYDSEATKYCNGGTGLVPKWKEGKENVPSTDELGNSTGGIWASQTPIVYVFVLPCREAC